MYEYKSQMEEKSYIFIVNRVILRDNWRTRIAFSCLFSFDFVRIQHFPVDRFGFCVIFETLHDGINVVTTTLFI